MAHVSDSALEEMTQGEIIMQMMSLLKVLGKKEAKSSKLLEKVEAKKEKSAPPKHVRPVQLDKSTAWVGFVHQHMLTTGWESFTHAERFGKGMADVQYPESMLTPLLDADGKQQTDEDGDEQFAHVFAGSVTKSNPNGDQPNMSHAMSVSKMYWSAAKKSGSRPDLYKEFEAQYVAPIVEGDAPASYKKVVSRTTMTLEEKRIAKEEKEAEKEAEKERKKREREAEKERKAKEKEAEKQAKAAAKVPKGVVKSKVPVSVKAPVPAAKASSSSSSAPKSVLKPSAIAAKPKQVVKEDWVPPAKGKLKEFQLNGITYLRDCDDLMWTQNSNGEPDEIVGVYIPATCTIDDNHPKLDELASSDDDE